MHPRCPRSEAAPRPSLPLRLAVLTVAAAAALSVAGCSKPASAAGGGKPAVTKCGTSHTAANVPVTVEVTRGQVACSDAMSVEHKYRQAILDGKAAGAGGGGPVNVGGWACQPYPTPEVLKTGWASRCTRSGAEILAILPLPS
jgi:hypothetical protein